MNESNIEESVALIDLDNTLTDYDLAMQRDLNLLKSPNEEEYIIGQHKLHPDYIFDRMKLIKSRGEWWESLPKLQLGFDILEVLRDLDFYISILTQGPKENTVAWSHKLSWCLKNVPDLDVTITRNKGLVYGKVLVDDYPPYVENWLKHRKRGLVIMPAHFWNKDFTHSQVIRYDGSNIDEVKKALEIVKNRKSGEELKI